MANMAPLGIGLVTFLAIGIVMCMISQGLRAAGKLSAGEASLMSFLVGLGGVCMWMMWSMTWLSQVNPILFPEATNYSAGGH
ncbi:V-type proton ATPase subunit e1 [Hondaea fermentalgiana]|uniref:V-type proton ATPase subunit e1 n=1 Tax=Hondaea fermentalgiana TaxID=2315210 RepID=A0A2R5GFN8_9STRA|nr:V-type proton ATPase subunit e1 [Hondaea fermentalgiana]|eukprot:GBG28558.1 V-type proton ATPase subunit e1 [Hondaea fermentalgiana]